MTDFQKYKWEDEKFLVADDDMYTAILLEKILKKTGATVFCAADGQEALEMIREQQDISVAILDIVMPFLNGYEVIKEARKIRPELIYVACTADVIRLDPAKCKRLGFTACISKPFLPQRLFAVLEEALMMRSQLFSG
jgi:two-component system response regulator VicR